MTLVELKKFVDFAVEHSDKPEDIKVVITLANPSVGSRAYSEINYVGLGFDYEHGQFRIEPEDKLRKEGRTLDDVDRMIVFQYLYDKKTTFSYHCPNCEEKLPKTAHFCTKCGKRVVCKDSIDLVYDYRNKI